MQQATVVGQRWTDLPVPELGAWTPVDRVCVVLPARDNQTELERTLAALAHQTYPAELLEVVVVDDSSQPPLTLPDLAPAATRIVRRDQAATHGSGAARHAGAVASDADILLFLDSDMLADPRHVEAHARWHHVCDHALVLGRKWFVEADDLTPAAIAEAGVAGGGVADLLAGRTQVRHAWQEDLIREQERLTRDVDDAFLAVVGATVSLRRDSYERSRGFAPFGLRGIVDTEFGYRAFTTGCVIVPDDEARAWHQGARSFARRGAEIKKERLGLAANHLPIPMFRQQNAGRTWAVPMVRVVADATETDLSEEWAAERLLLSVDAALASTVTDLAVTVMAGDDLPQWLRDYVAADPRVELVTERPAGSGFPSPFTVVVPPGAVLEPTSLSTGLGLLSERVRVVRTLPGWAGARGVEIWRTRTLERALRAGLGEVDPDVLGEHWVTEKALGVTHPQPRLTPQGMVTTW